MHDIDVSDIKKFVDRGVQSRHPKLLNRGETKTRHVRCCHMAGLGPLEVIGLGMFKSRHRLSRYECVIERDTPTNIERLDRSLPALCHVTTIPPRAWYCFGTEFKSEAVVIVHGFKVSALATAQRLVEISEAL